MHSNPVASAVSAPSAAPLLAALQPLLSRVRTDVSAIKLPGAGSRWTDEALTQARLVKHLNGGPARGVCPIKAGESTTQVAVLDLDSHDGASSWTEMQQAAATIVEALGAAGLHAVPFRSSGGRGIHLYLLWDAPQDAYSVRTYLADLLAGIGYRSGTKGIAAREVEIFPKQDAVPADGYGNQFILPYAGASVPLELLAGMEAMGRDYPVAWPDSATVPVRVKPERPAQAPVRADLAELRSALVAIPNVGDDKLGYDDWLSIIFGIHSATGGSDEGLALAHEFSAKSGKHVPEFLEQRVWPYMTDREGGITAATVFAAARAHGWGVATLDDFDDVSNHPLTESEARELAEIRQRNAKQAAKEAARTLAKAKALADESRIDFVDMASLAHTTPSPRRWIVRDWLPRGAVTALFGRGGHGKSLLAQQLATCVATGTAFMGSEVTQGNVIALFCEDEPDELLRRGSDLFKAMFLDAETAAKGLHLDGRAGKFNMLARVGQDRLIQTTPLMDELFEQCRRHAPALVVLDNLAQMFGGIENDRAHVTQFCNALTGLAREFGCSVLLLGHTAKAEGSEYSGSTAWDAAVRSRLHLERKDDDTTTLARLKANYASIGEVALRYVSGCFVQVTPGSVTNPEVEASMEVKIIDAIRKATVRQQSLSSRSEARNRIDKVMFGSGDISAKEAPVALRVANKLIDEGRILPGATLPWKNSSRHPVQGLAVVDEREQ